jgi:tetratricopeptide (TPR) repeat protein/uncharacterized caspase-like protein
MAIDPHLGEEDEEKGVKKALIIGVSDYEDKSLDPLPFCKNDAEEMHSLLTSLGFDIPVYNMMVGEVKERKMKEAIANFFQDSGIKSRDTILFYFAGHGVPDNSGEVYMASSETNFRVPFIGSFPFQQLTKLMNGSFSTRIITILDCCHSGAFELTTGSRGDPNDVAKKAHIDIEDKSNALKQGRGKCLIAASESTQRAYEIKEKNHGIFTYYLLEGLKGKPQSVDEYGNVTVDRLADYVYDTISNLPPEKKPNQMPIRKVEGGGRIILAYHPDLAKRQPQQQQPPGVQTSSSTLKQVPPPRQLFPRKFIWPATIATSATAVALSLFFAGIYTQSELTADFVNKGNDLLNTGRYEEAIEYFDKVPSTNPNYVEALGGKGRALFELGRYQEAISYYDEALAKDPNYDFALNNKGIALSFLGRWQEAIPYFDRALAIDPNYVNALSNKGGALMQLGRYQEAISYFDRALDLAPDYGFALEAKGDALAGLGRYQEAISYFDRALDIDSNDWRSLNGKGISLAGLGRYQEAISYYDKALTINPNATIALDNKGLALDMLEKSANASGK